MISTSWKTVCRSCPILRFDRIEVLKGSGQLIYGPQTIGGVMNFITRRCMLTASLNQYVKKINTTFFFVAQNMLDQTTIMNRTCGIYQGLPKLW